jgi:prepilin-type N-terminal cleavage/methylation domain-containing protein
MNQRGFSLIEILTVMIMVGIMVSIAIPRFGFTLSRQDVRGARNLFTTTHAKARASAVSRGRRTAFAIKNGELAILSAHPVTGAVDTVGSVDDLIERFGVTFTVDPSSRVTLVFDGRGLGTEATTTTVIVSKAGYADTISIAPLGRVIR